MPERPPFALDPFVFPPETKGRFRMLIAAALAFSWSLSAWFVQVPNPYTYASRIEPEVQEAMDKLRAGAPITREDAETVMASASAKAFANMLFAQALRIVLALFVLAACGVGTWVLYDWHPELLRRRHKTGPLTSAVAADEIRQLAAVAGLDSDLHLEHKPGGLADGIAFGRRGREVLVLAGNPRILARSWNDFTRAVALHEIGHIVNDDIRSRELSRAMWIIVPTMTAVAAAVILHGSLASGDVRFPVIQPLGAAETRTTGSDLGALAQTVFKTAASFFVLWWIWAGLIRAREHYADYRVSSWGFRQPLLLLLRLPEAHRSWWPRLLFSRFVPSRLRQWRGLTAWSELWEKYSWRRHPSKATRVKALQEPIGFFRAGADLAFLTGLLLALIGAQLTSLSTDLITLTSFLAMPLFFFIGPFILLIYLGLLLAVTLTITGLVTGALGVQIQRQTVADLATRPHHEWGYLRLGWTAFFFALGLEGGLLISPLSPFDSVRSPGWSLAWLLGFTLFIWMWLLYLRAATRLVLGPHTGAEVPRSSLRWITGSSVFLLTALFWPALAFRMTIEIAGRDSLLAALTPAYAEPTEHFAYIFLMTSLVLFALGVVLYTTIMAACVLGAALRLVKLSRACPACGDAIPYKLVIGRRCTGCGQPLAAWLLEHREPQAA